MHVNYVNEKDYAVIAMVYLVLIDMGFFPALPDPSDTSLVKHCGPHTMITLPLLLRDDVEFPQNDFSDRLDAYSKLSTVKPHASSFEYFPAVVPDPSAEVDPATGTLPTKALENFSTFYIEVFI